MQGGGQRAGSGVCQADATRRLIHSDTLSEHGHTHTASPPTPTHRHQAYKLHTATLPSNAQERGGEERRLSFNKTYTHTQISHHSNTKVAFSENH